MQRANQEPDAARHAIPPFRADHVGSLLRPQELKNAFRDFHSGKLDPDKFCEIQDRCIRDAVAMQREAGLQSITDGEFRRGSWFMGLIEALDGLATKDALFDFRDDTGKRVAFQAAYVEAKLRRRRGITTAEYSFVRSVTDRTPKVTMPAPSILHFYRGDETVNPAAYSDLERFWFDVTGIYRDELRELGDLGCTYVQLDEVACAMLCDPKVRDTVHAVGMDPERLVETYIEAINSALAGRPAHMTVALHLCRGNYKGRWMAEGGYDLVAERLFGRADVDAFFLEYDSPRAGGFEPLRFVPADKRVVLGLVSTKTPELEPLDALKRRVEEASRFVPSDRLCISPQCGFASSVGGNPLTIDDERRKLALVVDAAQVIWG